jgi:hypothetical protein
VEIGLGGSIHAYSSKNKEETNIKIPAYYNRNERMKIIR